MIEVEHSKFNTESLRITFEKEDRLKLINILKHAKADYDIHFPHDIRSVKMAIEYDFINRLQSKLSSKLS